MQKRYLLRSFSLLTILLLLLFNNVSNSSAFLDGDSFKQSTFEKLNLLILVKASQSSSHRLSDLSYSKSRLEIIQDSIPSVLEQHPLPPNANFGIMAYGHVIDRAERELSCSSDNIEQVVPFQAASSDINMDRFLNIEGHGEAPTTLALEEAGKVFTQASPEVLNVILLIADGSDTCGLNPVEKAKELAESKNIAIYTIGFMANKNTNKELEDIANQTFGKFSSISPYIDDGQEASDELTKAIQNVFDNLFSQISIPSPTDTFTSTEVVALTPTFTDTPTPISTPTVIPTQPGSNIISPAPVPTEEQPLQPIGIFEKLLAALGIILVAAFIIGLLVRWPRTPTKVFPETPAVESKITDVEQLEQFKKDLFKAYASIEAKKHYSKFIPLEAVKKELSSKFTPELFDKLLKQARQKYPNNIWIDRDAKDQPVYIKIRR